MSIDFSKSAPSAVQPLQLTPGSVGSDLFSTITLTILPSATIGVPTSLIIKLKEGYAGLITGRSGLALKGIQCHVGIIDCNFYGDIKVILTNCSPTEFKIFPGDRIAQISIIKYFKVVWQDSKKFSAEAERWAKSSEKKHLGFGSTGI